MATDTLRNASRVSANDVPKSGERPQGTNHLTAPKPWVATHDYPSSTPPGLYRKPALFSLDRAETVGCNPRLSLFNPSGVV